MADHDAETGRHQRSGLPRVIQAVQSGEIRPPRPRGPGALGWSAVHGVHLQAPRRILHVRHFLHRLQDHQHSVWKRYRAAAFRRLQGSRHAVGFLLLAARYASHSISRYVEARLSELARRTNTPGMAALSRLHAIAADRIAFEVWPGGGDLVRWFGRSAKVRWLAFFGPDPALAIQNPGERPHRGSGRFPDSRAVHS